MPRAALSSDAVERFRDALCEVAARRFAEHGYAGVTLRALAAELGCSPMTPYRYFANKAEIFAAVRSAALLRFADALAAGARAAGDPVERLQRLGRAYVHFALDDPNAYRIMFELEPPAGEAAPPSREELRGWKIMRSAVGEAVASGALRGDPDILAHLFWSTVHGLVTLHLAGKLELGLGLEELVEAFLRRELTGDTESQPFKENRA